MDDDRRVVECDADDVERRRRGDRGGSRRQRARLAERNARQKLTKRLVALPSPQIPQLEHRAAVRLLLLKRDAACAQPAVSRHSRRR